MHILFDLDGTLSDARPGILASINYALERMGEAPRPEEELAWTLGPPLQWTFGRLLEREDEERINRAVDFYRERFVTGKFENDVYEGIPELLAALASQGHTLYVATSKPAVFATEIITHFSLGHFFRTIYGSELDGLRGKKEDLLAWLLQEEGLSPDTSLMIGDRSHDVHGAIANGIDVIGALWGYGSREELEEAGCRRFAAGPGDVVGMV